jgi:hypothetical protein
MGNTGKNHNDHKNFQKCIVFSACKEVKQPGNSPHLNVTN